MFAAISGNVQSAAWPAGAKSPALPPKIPKGSENRFWRLRAHGNQAAAGRAIGTGENLLPTFAAIGGFVDASFVVVVPQVPGGAGIDGVAVLGIDQNLGDVLGIL